MTVQGLHLHAGPIDLIIRAWGTPHAVRTAYDAAGDTFDTILPALCRELAHLRTPLPTAAPHGPVARAMHAACAPYAARFITPMAAVAGAVADHVLAAMTEAAPLDRALVNNRGDIAFHLTPGQTLRCALVADLADPGLDGAFLLQADHPARGIATSGRACKGQGGRSFSFGIADAVTVLARSAAAADAVDLPGHPAIDRRPARSIDPDSDLGDRLVTWQLGPLSPTDIGTSLDAGRRMADGLRRAGQIDGAVLCLRNQVVSCLDRTPNLSEQAA
jgi:ApbE superfamily uncharacterized protein (UPF0280 family)